QIGAPMDVYLRPASRFVASFIGSPGMNFLPVEVARPGPGPIRMRNGFEMHIDAPIPSAGQFDLGIRPEAVQVLTQGDAPPGETTEASINVVERLGERTLAYCRLDDGTEIIAQDAGR